MRAIVQDTQPSLNKMILRGIFVIFVLLFHFYGSLVLFFTYAYSLAIESRRDVVGGILRHFRFYGWSLIVALPIWAYFAFGFDKTYMAWNPYEYIPKGIIPLLRGVFGNLIGFKPFYIFLGTFVLAFLIPHKERKAQMIFFLILVLCPVALIFWSCITYQYWFIQRLFVWVMPFFAFLLGWQVDSLVTYFLSKKYILINSLHIRGLAMPEYFLDTRKGIHIINMFNN
jgi:hypothetical protein